MNQSQIKKNIKKSGKKGGSYFNKLTPGDYVYEISHYGYVTATGTFFVNSVEMTKLIVKLSKKQKVIYRIRVTIHFGCNKEMHFYN